MKESVGSLRAFFILVGILGGLGNGFGVLGSLVVLAVKPLLGIVLLALCGVGVLLALGYLYCGVSLPMLLQSNPAMVIGIVTINIIVQVLGYLLTVVLQGFSPAGMLLPMIGLLISVYLLNSVKRLAGG